MDEQIEKIIALAGNQHRYQYFTLIVMVFLWINCNFIAIIIPFIEREPLINYTDEDGKYHSSETLTNEICDLYAEKDDDYEIVERFKYSWVSELDIECSKLDVSLIGVFVFVGNTAGAVVFSIINKLITHKAILIISSFGFCSAVFLNTLIKSYTYFYCSLACLVFIGMFGNCLCYSSLVLAEEIVSSDKRSLFSSIINVGYSLSGVLYSLAFWYTQDWRIVFYICIGASIFVLILIWVFIYDSPRGFINKKDFKNTMRILEGIASFNGRLNEFREALKQEEFQDIISAIKGIELPDIRAEDNSNEAQNHIYDIDKDKVKNIENEENKENDEKKQNEEKKEGEQKENIELIEKDKNMIENEIKENLDIYRETHKDIYRETNKDYRDTAQNINRASDRESGTNAIKDSDESKKPEKKLSEPLIRRSTVGRKSKIQDINVWSLFKYRSIRYKFIILNILWIGTRASFNGIAISSKSFRGNFYINIIILYVIESISYCVSGCIIDINSIGRRGALWIQYSLIIGSFLLLAFFHFDVAPELMLNYLARFCAAGIEVVYYTYSIEVYPTLVRSVAFGVNLTFGNGGSIIAPLILEYLDNWLFLTVFAIVCAINSLLLFFLPETCGKPMIETIAELDD